MSSDDRYADGKRPARLLSEQLRELEAEHGPTLEISLPPQGRCTKLPTSLGRPIGLTHIEAFPRILSVEQDANAVDGAIPVRGRKRRRGIAIAGTVLLLFTFTSILPPLIWRYAERPQTPPDEKSTSFASGRTDQFANVARDLALAPHAAMPRAMPTLCPGGTATEASPQPRLASINTVAQPVDQRQAQPEAVPVAARSSPPTAETTLEIPESDLSSLTLPKIVAGLAPTSTGSVAGSAVVIDGLPDTARVSPGIRIARDSWAVGIRDVDYAVLSLPRDTPERLDLVVRVVAADSQQLAANTLHLRVLRAAHTAAPRRAAESAPATPPRARFEPASGVGAPGLEAVVPLPARKPTIVLKRTPPPSPAWPTSVSTWTQTEPPSAPLLQIEKAPAWAPF